MLTPRSWWFGLACRGLLWLAWGLMLWGAQALAAPPPTTDNAAERAVLQVFVRDGCPHCADAKAYLPQWTARHPQVQVWLRPVDTDTAARDDLMRLSERAGVWPPGVPTFVYGERLLVGFANARLSGPELDALVAPTPAERRPIDEPAHGPVHAVETPWGALTVDRLGLPLFTVALGLLDGFNPCAMWVLLFLLSLLVHLGDRRRMALIAGTFVLVGGAVYYAFMAAWLNVFLAVGLGPVLRVALALLALLMAAVNLRDAWRDTGSFSLSIPDRAKPGLYARMRQVMAARSLPWALVGVAALAVAVNFVELLCTAGLPALYTAVLAQQALDGAAHHGYLGLYILAYLADDGLMVGSAVWALSSRKLDATKARWLKALSGAVMLTLGLVMLLRPDWLL